MQVFSVTVASVKKTHSGKRRGQQEKCLPAPGETGPPYKEKLIFKEEKLVLYRLPRPPPSLGRPRRRKRVGAANGRVRATAGVGGCLSSGDFRSHPYALLSPYFVMSNSHHPWDGSCDLSGEYSVSRSFGVLGQ